MPLVQSPHILPYLILFCLVLSRLFLTCLMHFTSVPSHTASCYVIYPYPHMWFCIPLSHLTLSSLIHLIFISIVPSCLITLFLPNIPFSHFISCSHTAASMSCVAEGPLESGISSACASRGFKPPTLVSAMCLSFLLICYWSISAWHEINESSLLIKGS